MLAGKTNLSVSLRRRDYLQENADRFNRVVEHVAAKDRTIETLREALRAKGVDPSRVEAEAAHAGQLPTIRPRFSRIGALCRDLHENIDV